MVVFDPSKTAAFLAAEHAARSRFEPLTGDLLPPDQTSAYAAGQALVELWRAGGRGNIAGYKIALTSKAVQEMLGVNEPCAGAIFESVILHTPARISRADYVRVGLEFEICLRLGKGLPGASAPYAADTVRDAVDAAIPAFEMVEDRNADYSKVNVESLIADNAWNGALVLGEVTGDWRTLDLSRTPVTLTYNNEIETADTGAALGSPLTALAWLANLMVAQGRPLEAGMIVMTGSAMKTRFGEAGDRMRYEVEGLGSVEMDITA
jgi:2-keto-4-pentenoate hydratase